MNVTMLGEQGKFIAVNSHTSALLIYSDLMRPFIVLTRAYIDGLRGRQRHYYRYMVHCAIVESVIIRIEMVSVSVRVIITWGNSYNK